MRKGMNPNRNATVDGYAPIVLTVTTHLPNQKGYHKERMNVVKCCLETMRANAGDHDYQIMVWDNGSCDALTHWLKRSYQPDFLITGPNMGKSNARASMMRMLPPETIVGFSDDDMFYYPGWLDAHLEILNTYPNVGTVSGWPVRTQFRFHNHNTVKWAKRAALVKYGRFISEQEDRDFCISIGRDYENHSKVGTIHDMDVKINFRGVLAYATGHHCQMMTRAKTLMNYVSFENQAMREERTFEATIDQAGLLRLTTYKRYTRHIGNVLDKELEDEWLKLR